MILVLKLYFGRFKGVPQYLSNCSIVIRLQVLNIMFSFLEHQNWFGNDENLGPVALSIKREKVEHVDHNLKNGSGTLVHYQYRLIIRTSEVSPISSPNIKHYLQDSFL